MNLLTIISYFIYVFIFLKLGILIFEKLNKFLENEIFNRRLELGILSIQDLYKFGFDKFLSLSEVYLEDLGFKNLTTASIDYKNVDFTCDFKGEKVYVQCILDNVVDVKNGDEEIYSIGAPKVQKMLGQMVHDGVKYGIIITNGCCSNESLDFAEHQDGEHKVLLVDGYHFTKGIRTLKESKKFLGDALYE